MRLTDGPIGQVGINQKLNSSNLWPLKSGVWERDSRHEGFLLNETAFGRKPSPQLNHEDLSELVQAGRSIDASRSIYPPEFKFSPSTGKPLQHPLRLPLGVAWVPPFGAATLGTRTSGAAFGLRQAAMAIKLAHQDQRRADAEPDHSLSLPPAGDYEYFSTPAGSGVAVLLALEPAKGLLYLLRPVSKSWELFDHVNDGHQLAVSRCARAGWRCEVAVEGLRSLIFLPTELGLACLIPDAVSLSFSVSYFGAAPSIGAPMQFGKQIWAPLLLANGRIRLVSATVNGEAGAQVDLPAVGVESLGSLHVPIVDSRTAIWPCDAGQLLLRKLANGEHVASFLPWPASVQPAFEFGSPYLSRDGHLWQLCFDVQKDSYVYLQLGVDKPEHHTALAPRLCSGGFYYRFADKLKSEPWSDPENDNGVDSNQVVVPLLESAVSPSVLGLKLNTAVGLAGLLRSTERMRAELVLDDATGQTAFHIVAVAELWRMRVFIHAGVLWVYHPLLSRLNGWTLQV